MKRLLAIFYLSTFLFNYIYSVSNYNAKSIQERPLVAGDTFTPQEMLPIANKLLKKVDEPGNGKGFVSSTKSPEELSDKLFEALFLTNKRIVTLTDYDVTSIDALQALALSGEDIEAFEETSTQAGNVKFLRGQFVEVQNGPRRSQYKLVTKPPERIIDVGERRGIPLAKKLGKTRNLIINKRRNNSEKGKENEKSKKQKRNCRWIYVCDSAADLDSCKLKANCSRKNSDASRSSAQHDITVQHQSDEHTLALIQFRKMVGISLVDEEVEKILESRNKHLNTDSKDALNKVETLSENFEKIIVLERIESTTPISLQLSKNDKEI